MIPNKLVPECYDIKTVMIYRDYISIIEFPDSQSQVFIYAAIDIPAFLDSSNIDSRRSTMAESLKGRP